MSGMMGGSARPKVKAGDYERALALIAELGGDKVTRKYLEEIVAASAAHVEAREEAEAAGRIALRREEVAREAEADARSQREALATETTRSETRLSALRGELTRERERLEPWATELEEKQTDINLREGALKRAFHAYNGE